MKLKKAMKKYKIEIVPPHGGNRNARYKIGNREIYVFLSGEWDNNGSSFTRTESEAVAWLIEGAIPLSPMERAMRKWPIEDLGTKNNNLYHTYKLGDREVFQSSSICIGKWLNGIPMDRTIYTEKEAVAYLLEGYKPKMPDVKVILEHVDVEKDKKITGIDKNVCLGFGPTQAQTVLDTIWRAGYRPTKDAPIG